MRGPASTPLLPSSFTLIHSWLTKMMPSFCIRDWYAQMKMLIHSWKLVSVATKLSNDFPPSGHKKLHLWTAKLLCWKKRKLYTMSNETTQSTWAQSKAFYNDRRSLLWKHLEVFHIKSLQLTNSTGIIQSFPLWLRKLKDEEFSEGNLEDTIN